MRVIRRSGILLFLGTIFTIALILGATGQKASFPGKQSETVSPNGRFKVRNSDYDERIPAPSLTLIDSRSMEEHKLYVYGRHVDVLWSPDSRALVVNDYEGSDFSKAVLIEVPEQSSRIDLWEKLIEFLRSSNAARSALQNHHVYLTAEKWLNSRELLCKLTGYGEVDPKGFTRHYIYQRGAGFRNATKTR
jgi:hypothetical protein